MVSNYSITKMNLNLKSALLFFYLIVGCLFFKGTLVAQNYELVTITGVAWGNNTNNTLFKATSKTIPSLAYIRAQRINGPQNGIFTQQGDDIRYIAISTSSGIPSNLSRIRFSFLKSDKKTLIEGNNFRFIINDIDGPNNEALATDCDANLRYLGTANPTNLIVANLPPNIIAVGSVEEQDGPTSRVMFEFYDVSVVELDNYANNDYLKDFDMNNDYPIASPIYVKCKTVSGSLYTQNSASIGKEPTEFKKNNDNLLIKTNAIYFDLDKSEIREDATLELEKVVGIMNKYSEIHIDIQSHTDSRAKDKYNMKLSNERAKSSANWIIEKGIDSARITTKGFGETKLVNKCSNGVECTEEEHQMNRRTEFVVINPEVLKKQ